MELIKSSAAVGVKSALWCGRRLICRDKSCNFHGRFWPVDSAWRAADIGFRGNRMIASGSRGSTGESNRMDAFYERLAVRAATPDEVLSHDFEPLPGQKGDADLAARRLAAWCRACASGDWSLFGRRLDRDSLAFAPVLSRLAGVRRASVALPSWIEDAVWVEAALQDTGGNATPVAVSDKADPCAFEQLFTSL